MSETLKVWVDDTRPAPSGYVWCKTVIQTKMLILAFESHQRDLEELFNVAIESLHSFGCDVDAESLKCDSIGVLDLDHDAGTEYSKFGGDYIKILDWLEETGRNYPIRIHSMNSVGVQNMRAIIQKNGWKEIR